MWYILLLTLLGIPIVERLEKQNNLNILGARKEMPKQENKNQDVLYF